MDPSVIATNKTEGTADIAFVGAGPSALVAAIALARRGIRTTVFERDAHPEVTPRFNPDRSYTIDGENVFPNGAYLCPAGMGEHY